MLKHSQTQFLKLHSEVPSINKTQIEDIIAKGYDKVIVARAVVFPKILIVKSIAKITRGNENADQVSFRL